MTAFNLLNKTGKPITTIMAMVINAATRRLPTEKAKAISNTQRIAAVIWFPTSQSPPSK
jgi:hypothetical protein